MAIDLMALEPQQISRDLRGKYCMIYGPAGCGKSELASQFPKSLLCGFEQGSNGLHQVYVQPMKTWSDWKQTVAQLLKKPELKDKFYTICIDTAEEAYKLCEKWVCQQFNADSIKEVAGYGQGYKILDDAFMTPFRDLTYAGYGLVFISHSKDKPDPLPNDSEHTKAKTALPDRAFDLLNKMVDLVGYISVETTEEGQARYIYFRETQDFFAKSRFKYIKPKVDFSYKSIVDAIYSAIDKQVEIQGGAATNEQNPYAQQSFEDLMEEAKALWNKAIGAEKINEVGTILKEVFGKPIKFSEILPEQIEQLKDALIKIKDLF